MLKLIILGVIICVAFVSSSQEEQQINSETEPSSVVPPPQKVKPKPKGKTGPVIEYPDVQSVFPGNRGDYEKYIAENLKYPESSLAANEEGQVYVGFIVETDGSISHVNVQRGVNPDLDAEALRLVRNMPKWIPGELSGKKVRTLRLMPILFELPETN